MKQIIKKQLAKLPDPRTREGVKTISRFVVARATSFTIVAVIRNNTDPDNTLETAGVFIGSHVLGEMVADATAPFVDRQIDEYADSITEARQAIQEAQAEMQTEPSTV